MNNDTWPKRILDYQVPGTNIKGGQKKKWIHNVKKDLDNLHLKPSMAQNRNEWRRAIKAIQQQNVVRPSTLGNQGR